MIYTKFVVTSLKGDDIGSQVPVTGVELALELAREHLAIGQTVEITPFTQNEWAKHKETK